jgi:hypothetical protein
MTDQSRRAMFRCSFAPACLFLLLAGIAGCGYTQLARRTYEPEDQNIVAEVDNYQPEGDSLCLHGYYYRYVFNAHDQGWQTAPEWILGNLHHFGIEVQDAWHIESDNPYPGTNIITGTLYPPGLIVRIRPDNRSILGHHFQKCEPYPLSHFKRYWRHYQSSREK